MNEFAFVTYYPFPLISDNYHYIWAADNMMAFEFCNIDEPENMQKVVDIINGLSEKSLPNITIEYPYIKCCGQNLLEVRGKSLLMAKYNLEENDALIIQKLFMEYCAKNLGKTF